MQTIGTFSRRTMAVVGTMLLVLGGAQAAAAGVPVWGTVDSPNQGDLQNALADVKAFSPTDVWVVGEYNPGLPPTETGRRTLTEHWDGSNFSILPSPNADWPGVDKSTLNGVSGVSSKDVGRRIRGGLRLAEEHHPYRALGRHRMAARPQPESRRRFPA